MPIPVHAFLTRYRTCLLDKTAGDTIPSGWRSILYTLMHDVAEVLAAFPGRSIDINQIRPRFGILRVYTSCDSDPQGLAIAAAVHPIIVAAAARSARTCEICGAPGRQHRDRGLWATLCEDHSRPHDDINSDALELESDGFDPKPGKDDALDPESSPAAARYAGATNAPSHGSHKLYDRRTIALALGRPANWPDDEIVHEPAETEHEGRLLAILRRGEEGTWRQLAHPTLDIPERLDALDAVAPHMQVVTALVRRHVTAALAIGLPISLPPIMLLGEPGVGKTFYLNRLGTILGVPTRTYPMSASSLSEGLQGSHKSWRNASPGLVAKTLLQERVANPLILVDEIDKAGFGSWNADPFRPFYAALEPSGSQIWRDEYLDFEIDASRVMWVLAGNSLQALPDAILSRLTIIEVPALSRDYLTAVACSVYSEANEGMQLYFEPQLIAEVLDKLVDLSPRAIRLVLQDAMVRAAADGRRCVRAADIEVAGLRRQERIGFMRIRA